jgi:threonine/homoserine/homoserine lactone efflux protein
VTGSLVAFALFAAVLAITPGLDTFLVLRTTAAGGRAAGLAAVVGIGLGCLVWAVASAIGVTAILSASRLAFEVLRIAGVAYLCWLGGRALWFARRPAQDLPPAPAEEWGRWRALRTGLTTNLLNPKVGVFYLSVLPQFLPNGLNPLVGSLALAAIHVGEGFVWLTLVVLAVNRASGWLTRPTVRRRLEQLSGVVFLGFGLRLALERAP